MVDTETLRFLAVNDAALRLYEYPREEFLAMRAADIRRAEDDEPFSEFLRGESGAVQYGVFRHLKRTGEPIDIDGVGHRVAWRGRPARLARTMTWAPASLANCSPNSDTPPVPCTTTTSPGFTSPSSNADQAVRAAIGRAAASTSLRWGGVATASSAGTTTYSCSTPDRGAPSVRFVRCSGVGYPSCQPCV